MKSERKQLWEKLMDVWGADTPACQVYVADVYTRKFPDDFFGWLVLGDGLTQISSFDAAAAALGAARRLGPTDIQDYAFTKIGNYYLEKGDIGRAEKWYRKAVAFSESQENLVFLGACLAKQGRYTEAKNYHNRSVLADPSRADEALFNPGLIYRAEAKYVAALRYFNKSIEIDPDYDLAKVAREDIERVLKIQASEKHFNPRRRKSMRST